MKAPVVSVIVEHCEGMLTEKPQHRTSIMLLAGVSTPGPVTIHHAALQVPPRPHPPPAIPNTAARPEM